MNPRKQAYKEFATMVARLVNSRESGNWPNSAETFCTVIESKLDEYNYGFDHEKLKYKEDQPAYELFYEAVANKINGIPGYVSNKKDLEKKSIYESMYEEIKELFGLFNLGGMLEDNPKENQDVKTR